MEINLEELTRKLLLELSVESDKMKLRAEGVSLLYERIRQSARSKEQDTVPSTQETGTEQKSP